MKLINNMNESEAKKLLNDIADVFGIGSLARSSSTILANVRNSAAHEFCIKPPSEELVDRARLLLDIDDPVYKYIRDAAGIIDEDEDES